MLLIGNLLNACPISTAWLVVPPTAKFKASSYSPKSFFDRLSASFSSSEISIKPSLIWSSPSTVSLSPKPVWATPWPTTNTPTPTLELAAPNPISLIPRNVLKPPKKVIAVPLKTLPHFTYSLLSIGILSASFFPSSPVITFLLFLIAAKVSSVASLLTIPFVLSSNNFPVWFAISWDLSISSSLL